jgi:hypothetical protein
MPVVGREPSHVSFRVNTLHAVVSLPLGNQASNVISSPKVVPQPTTTPGEGAPGGGLASSRHVFLTGFAASPKGATSVSFYRLNRGTINTPTCVVVHHPRCFPAN